MTSSLAIHEEDEGKTLFLLFEHGKANEMGSEQLEELEQLSGRLRSGGVRTLVTYSKRVSRRGTPIFVAGANVTERVGWSDAQVKEHVRWQRAVLSGLATAPVFHVVVVSGVALGWGTEYLLTGDYRIATEGAVFGLPETGLGIVPGAGGLSELWSHVGVAQALRLGMTGERIDAAEAVRIGLCQEYQPTLEKGLERARILAGLVGRTSPTAVAAFKQGVQGAVGAEAAQRREREARAYEHCVDTGEAALGRAQFDAIRRGEDVSWSTRILMENDDANA